MIREILQMELYSTRQTVLRVKHAASLRGNHRRIRFVLAPTGRHQSRIAPTLRRKPGSHLGGSRYQCGDPGSARACRRQSPSRFDAVGVGCRVSRKQVANWNAKKRAGAVLCTSFEATSRELEKLEPKSCTGYSTPVEFGKRLFWRVTRFDMLIASGTSAIWIVRRL